MSLFSLSFFFSFRFDLFLSSGSIFTEDIVVCTRGHASRRGVGIITDTHTHKSEHPFPFIFYAIIVLMECPCETLGL